MRKLCFLATLVLTVLAGGRLSAQDFSNKGTDFWVAYGYATPMVLNGNSQEMRLYFASDSLANVTVSIPGVGYSQTYTIPANSVVTSNPIPKNGPQDVRLTTESTGPENKGIHITSDKPIVAYAHIYNGSCSGATILFPTNTLGKEYYSINYQNTSNADTANAWAYVIATDTGTTTVEITPSANTIYHGAGLAFTVNLTQGQVYNIMGLLLTHSNPFQGVDLTGTKIRSVASGSGVCKKIAVFSGSGRISITCNANSSSSDNYMVQSFPKSAWGKRFLTATSGGNQTNNIYRVCVSDPTAAVLLNGAPIPYPLINNFYYQIPFSNAPNLIEADKPILVSQYFTSQGACTNGGQPGDPEVILLSPVEQNINKVLWNATPNFAIQQHYFNVVIPNAGTALTSFVLRDAGGNPLPTSAFITHPRDPKYSYLKQLLPGPGVYSIQSDTGFNAIAYGFGNAESYGYNAGTNVRDLNQALEVNNQYGNETSPNVCINSPFQFKVYFPDKNQATPPEVIRYDSIKWDISNRAVLIPSNFPYVINGSPTVTPDSVNVRNGKDVAWYSIPGTYTINTPGVYTVTLTVYRTSSEGCGNSIDYTFTLTVTPPPVASFIASAPGCYLEPVQFTETTPQTPKATYRFWWSFGDPPSGPNNNATIRNPIHTYTSPGPKTVRFMNITTAGCLSDTVDQVIDIPDLPSATITGTTTVCKDGTNPTITFTGTDGKAPYTFVYNINGGPNQTISTAAGPPPATSVTLTAPTNVAGVFNYNLVSVQNTGSSVCVRPQTGTTTITVNPLPTATITGTATVCLNAPSPNVTFTGASGTAPYTFTYNINGGPNQTITTVSGNSVTVAAPTNVAGIFVYNLVSVQEGSAISCSQVQTGSITIIVNPMPTATITGDITVCLNAPSPNVTFTGTGGTAPYTFTYNINGGPNQVVTTVAGNSVTVAAPTNVAGTFVYNLLNVSDNSGTPCSQPQTGTVTVIVSSLPTATIAGTTTVCLNAPSPLVTFTGAGGAAPYTFTYNINGGPNQNVTTVSGNSVTVAASTAVAGTFVYNLVSVQEGSGAGCIQAQSGSTTIIVNPLPTATATGSTTVCRNAPSPNITFTGANGTAPYTFTYTINGGPNQVITTVSGNSITIPVPTNVAGTFTYTLVNVQEGSGLGCQQGQTGSATITVNDLPTATITGATEVCRNAPSPSVTFTGAGTTAPYTFTYNINGGPTLSITTVAGNSITLAVPTGVAGTFVYNLLGVSDGSPQTCGQAQTGSVTVVVNELPTANFNNTTPACDTREIFFTDISTPNSGTLTSWAWNFGDPASGINNTSTLQNPSHIFTGPGTYTITLVVTTDKGCVSTTPARQITINVKPDTEFDVPEVCINDIATVFSDQSTISSGSMDPNGYFWNFGDPASGINNTSTTQHGTHLFTAVGLYTVMHVSTSSLGCKDTIYHDIFINAADPVADFTVTNQSALCSSDTVSIVNRSTVSQGSVTKLEIYWDLVGAPGTFDLINTPVFNDVYKHKYPTLTTTRNYTIRMVAYSGAICLNTKDVVITVYATPDVVFNPMPTICYDAAPWQIPPAIAREIGGVAGTGVFSGPGVSPGGLFNPVTAGIGTHRILYTFTATAAGCVDTASNLITVWDTASASIALLNLACERSPVSFNANGSSIPGGNGTITGYTWNFGDPASGPNNTSTLVNPTHLFTGWGNYNVTLYVTTSNGCRSTVRTMPVSVNPIARPNFRFPLSACLPAANITFTNLSTIPDGTESSFSYLWNFGDPGSGSNNTATVRDPSHIFNSTGNYAINLQVTAGNGCVHDTTIMMNTIHPQPVGSFNVNKVDVCIGESFTFSSTSDPLDGTTTSWNWDLDDGNTRTVSSFTYTYPLIGTYDVSHYIINSHGCRSNTAVTPVSVNPYPVANAGPSKFMLEGGQAELTPVTNYPYPVSYSWSPGRYLVDSTIANAIARPPDDMYFRLTVTTNKGCSAWDTLFVKVLKKPDIPNIFSPNGDGVHDRWVIAYLDSYPTGTVEVVNRYGQLVFRSVGYPTPWDGKVNGKDVPIGTYYYVIKPGNGRAPLTGYVDIIR